MHKRVIIYFFSLLFIINGLLLAQIKESEDEQPAVNAVLNGNTKPEKKTLNEIYFPAATEIKKINEDISHSVFKQKNETESQNKKEEQVFNILSSSFRNNIKFGGFWGKYAIINFTPSVSVKPVSFINIYANHCYSCFVPMDGIKEHVKSLFIQSTAILAVDNTIKLLFNPENVIPKIAGFVFKTLVITEVMKTINKNTINRVYEYKYFRYSVSIRI